jgi:hypothetical protein
VNAVRDADAPAPAPPARALVQDEDAAKRQALIGRLRDDRQDLVRVANAVRDLAETLEAAQGSLAALRRALRWLVLVGGVAALTVSVRTRRRPPALLLTGVSLVLVQRWLSPPARREQPRARPPIGVEGATVPPPLPRSIAPSAARSSAG